MAAVVDSVVPLDCEQALRPSTLTATSAVRTAPVRVMAIEGSFGMFGDRPEGRRAVIAVRFNRVGASAAESCFRLLLSAVSGPAVQEERSSMDA
ncbi:hypothetical protein GCM10009851_33890 [Herbiconiux moechotypicola]|uniref:Uncharacterized protein n=1 Tax=Herbiconiux moechotypicola TaxID=637393 RepID=A0ABN3E0D1_9MICO